MGQAESSPSHYQFERQGDAFVLVSNDPHECFKFDPSESYLVSYGINLQTHPKFKKKTLGPSTTADAKQILTSMVNAGVIPRENATLYEATKHTNECTAKGMKRTFQEHARKVGPNGLFVFHFSGHGIRVVKTDQWGLAPVDFDYTMHTYLTASVLNAWLHDVNCKAKHILFTLDCCYAGGIATELTASGKFDLVSGLYVLTACTANEASLVLGPLGHSIFTFFLSRAIGKIVLQPGHLPLRQVFNECHTPSIALSSLIVSYSPDFGLKWGTMEPELKFLDVRAVALEYMGQGPMQVDAAVERFAYAIALYDHSKPIPPLEDKSIAWLETAASKSLITLEKMRCLEDEVLVTVLCSMLYSVASIEFVCNSAKLQNANHFVTTFMHVAATIDLVHHGVEFTEDNFLRGWQFYDEVVKLNLGRDDGLRKLYRKALRNKQLNVSLLDAAKAKGHGVGEDYTDFGQAEQLEADSEPEIPALTRWIPIAPEDM